MVKKAAKKKKQAGAKKAKPTAKKKSPAPKKKPVALKAKAKPKVKPKAKPKAKAKVTTGTKAKSPAKSKPKAKVASKKPQKPPTHAKTAKVANKKGNNKPVAKPKPADSSKPLKVVRVDPKEMDPILQKIRRQLIQERQELFNILQSSKELERNVSELNFSNEIDLAASLEGREMAFQLSSRDRNELKLIEDALFRIEDGSYGTCQSCTKTIGLKRLQIMPLTAYCIQCQESMERPSNA